MLNILVSDINLGYPNSTKKLVLDLKNTTQKSSQKFVFIIARDSLKVIEQDSMRQIFVPFYKSKNRFLRIFSEVYFNIISSFLILGYLFRYKYVRLAVISPSIFAFIPLLFSRLLGIKNRYLIQRDLFYKNISNFKKPVISYFMLNFLLSLFKLAIFNASKVGFENEADLASVKKHFPKLSPKYEVLFNWYERKNNHSSPSKKLGIEKLKIIYAGNLGIMQKPVEMIKSIKNCLSTNNSFQFHIYGSGTELDSTIKEIDESSMISYKGQVSESELSKILCQYDFGVVALDETKTLNNIPGKFLFYIDNYVPVLCVMNHQNFLKDLVEQKSLGIFINGTVTIETLQKFKAEKMNVFYQEVDDLLEIICPDKVYNKIWGAI